MRGRASIFVLATLLIGTAAVMVLAGVRGPDPDAVPTSSEVQDRIMSPFCAGLTVGECPTRESAELRRTINTMVASGRTNREIDAWVVANYGEAALGRPRDPVAWLVPAAALLGGLAIVLARLGGRARSAAPESHGDAAAPVSPEQHDRLLRELRSFAREGDR